jgi:hypothetical protein
MMDGDECGTVGGMIGRRNRSTIIIIIIIIIIIPAPVRPCSPQIPHDLTRARTQTAAVGSQRLSA